MSTERRGSTRQQQTAMALLRQAKEQRRGPYDPAEGLVSTETYYDREVSIAFVHWRTAKSLVSAGLVVYGDSDAEWGTELLLAEPGDA